jgi:hypothetical protein
MIHNTGPTSNGSNEKLSCTRGRSVHFVNRQHGQQESAVYKPCGSWICPACSRRLKLRWCEKIASSVGNQPAYLLRATVDAYQSSLRRWIARAGGSAYRIRFGDNAAVITNVPAPGAVLIEGDIAEVVAGLLKDVPQRKGKPCTAAGEWNAPRVEKDIASNQWEPAGSSPMPIAEVREVLKDYGIEPTAAKINGLRPKLTWEIPSNWTPQKRLEFWRRLHPRIRVRAVPMTRVGISDSEDNRESSEQSEAHRAAG